MRQGTAFLTGCKSPRYGYCSNSKVHRRHTQQGPRKPQTLELRWPLKGKWLANGCTSANINLCVLVSWRQGLIFWSSRFKRWFQEVKKRSSPILPPVWAVSGDPGKEFDVAGLCIFQIRRNPTMTEQASKEFRQKKQTHYTHSKIISQYLPCVVNYLL